MGAGYGRTINHVSIKMADIPLIEQSIPNDGFWPAVPVKRWVDGYKVGTDYREELAKTVLIWAMIKANKKLSEVSGKVLLMGYETLEAWIADNPAQTMAGEPLSSYLYLSVVYNLAKAAIVKPLSAMQRLPAGNDEDAAKGANSTESFFLDAAESAVASLLDIFEPGKPHSENSGVYVASISRKHRDCW